MLCSTPGLPVPQYLPEFAQVHVHRIGDAIQPFHLLSPFSPSAFSLSQDILDISLSQGLQLKPQVLYSICFVKLL